ncbi:30S ribosomal protein S9 [Candidatus Gottesmanbacteria bacterium]|nr:30S ribosomal protein S9 [Candidatus Gottesmanbacteria bacterium]
MVRKLKKSLSEEGETKEQKTSYYEAIGRRKEASARVRLYVVTSSTIAIQGAALEKGAIVVNGRPAENYFPGEVYKKMYLEAFRTTNTLNRFVVSVRVSGGGLDGQLGAMIHAVSRALEKVDKEKFRPILKKRGFMTRDPRAKQRRKAGFAGKARARKQSPKR